MFMHCRRLFSFLILVILCRVTTAFGQKTPPDPNYIVEFPGTLTVRTFLGEKISGFDLIDGKHSERLSYRPNNILGLGLGVTIRGIGINLSMRLPYHNYKEDRYGKTRQLDLQVHRYKGNFALDVYFQQYKGFHLRDSSDVSAVVGPTDYPYFPDMSEVTVGATGLYVFNGQRFSLRAPIDQQNWQIRSAGSWLLGGSVFTHLISNNHQSIIPPYLKRPEFMSGNKVQEIDNYSVVLNGGYGYNFIIKRHWFIGVLADVGAGIGYSEIKDPAGTAHKVGLQLSADTRFAFGYNATRWFGGFYLIYHADRYPLPYDDCFAMSNEGMARFIVARRFTTHKRRLGGSPD
jgi:hypothetical protein